MLELEQDVYRLIDPIQLVQRAADQVVDMVDGARGALVGTADGAGDVLYFCGSGIYRSWVGLKIAGQGSISGLCVRENRILVSEETATDDRVDAEACRRVNARSIVCLPVRRGPDCIGVVNVSSTQPHAFSDEDVALLSQVADFVSAVVMASAEVSSSAHRLLELKASEGEHGGEDHASVTQASKVGSFVANVLSPAAYYVAKERSIIQSLLDRRAIEVYYQPIVDLATNDTVAVESLSRIWEEPYRPPDFWFSHAAAVGLGQELEMLAVELAVASMEMLAPTVKLTVNASPATMLSPRFHAALLGSADPERLVVELTEHVDVDDYEVLLGARDLLRRNGVAVAIDDAGTGISGLAHILRLAPDFIKLDRDLVTGVDHDPARHALAESMVTFAAETGAQLIAEGIETQDELATLASLGVTLGQGFYLAVPKPLGDLANELVA